MANLLRASADYVTTPQDPILQKRRTASSMPTKYKFRMSKAPGASAAPDTFVATPAKGMGRIVAAVAKGVASVLKREPQAFQVVGVEDGILRQLASKCGEAAVTYNEVMSFLGAQGYEEFMTDSDSEPGLCVLMVMMRKSTGGRTDAPAGLQQTHAFVRRLPFRSCVTY